MHLRFRCPVVFALGFIIAACLVAVNALDWWRFDRAWTIGDRLTPAGWNQVVALLQRLEPTGESVSNNSTEAELGPLRPKSVFIRDHRAVLLLYDVGSYDEGTSRNDRLSVWIEVNLYPGAQSVALRLDGFGHTRSKILWTENMPAEQQTFPPGCLVTIQEWGLHDGVEWVVLDHQVLVRQRASGPGPAYEILSRIDLTPGQRHRIEAALSAIPPDSRSGHVLDPNVIDGFDWTFTFPDASGRGGERLTITNSWLADVAPLEMAINACLPDRPRIRHTENMLFHAINAYDAETRPRSSLKHLSWQADDDTAWRNLSAPWWCWWREFARREPPYQGR